MAIGGHGVSLNVLTDVCAVPAENTAPVAPNGCRKESCLPRQNEHSHFRSRPCTTAADAAAAARPAHVEYEREVEPDGALTPDERARRADRRAHMTKLAYLSAKGAQHADQ